MAGLTINQIVKIGIAVFVFVIVVVGVYLSFKNYILPYFKGISFKNEIILSLIR